MKALFTGVGSIGTRHIKNLSKICKERNISLDIDVIRNSTRRLDSEVGSLIRREIYPGDKADTDYDVLFVTDETAKHRDSVLRYKENCTHMFIEKPVFDHVVEDLDKIFTPEKGRIYYVAAPIRFTKYYESIKHIADKEKIINARIIFSDYMPSWQKNRDYRKSFRCYSNRGGGVDVDSIHEIDYMADLFGFPKNSKCFVGKYSELEMDACDIAAYLFEYDDKIVEVHLDYFGRVRNRHIELYTNQDIIEINFDKHSIEWKSGDIKTIFKEEDFYLKEMKYFIDLIFSEGNIKNINPPELAMKVLSLAKGEGDKDGKGLDLRRRPGRSSYV